MKTIKKPLMIILFIYVICYVLRILEYMVIRTDQTVIGEAFIHKVLGIVILCLALRAFQMKGADIGFTRSGILKYSLYGVGFGLAMFVIGYGVEIAVCKLSGNFVSLDFYVSSYAIDKNIAMNTSLLFIFICIAGNILNVLMEEGVFRGLFQKLFETKYRFIPAAVLSSLIFGLWHILGPIRNYIDAQSSLDGTIANVLMLGITSALIGFKFAMLSHMEGALYMGMGDHFVNNTIVNLLHVTNNQSADEFMFLRITVAQTVSFFIVLVVYLRKKRVEYKYDYQEGTAPGVVGS